MASVKTLAGLLASAALTAATASNATCDTSTLDNSTYYYNITVQDTTAAQVANITGRGICDIARWNLMVDVTIPANVGERFWIPAQDCEPDNTSCFLQEADNPQAECLLGGPRLYYTVNGDTYDKIALRLGMNVSAITSTSNGSPTGATGGVTNGSQVLEAGQFVKIPQCSPSVCQLQPYSFGSEGPGVYKDLAEKYATTVGQMMMLSATYNYSGNALQGGTPPPISIPINCTLLSSNYTVLQ
ncbi:uncharacterized protein BKA78DRAFT_384157 [Phyllosticta capitalensis]|uniref:LysM domain-containing protein n=1 Tax=Phyllosticta capitalensis TaxID=121624 RepID=A0ABR1Y9T8_9PEZI